MFDLITRHPTDRRWRARRATACLAASSSAASGSSTSSRPRRELGQRACARSERRAPPRRLHRSPLTCLDSRVFRVQRHGNASGFAAWKHGIRLLLLVSVLLVTRATAAEVIPPEPTDHFNDYAGIVSAEVGRQLNNELTQFERDTSNQIVVAIYPKMESDSSIEDYTVRVAQAWGVGQQDRKNGAVLFVFQQDRAIYIQVGYGLEGALPDITAKQIIENEIIPRFRAGDFQGGVVEGTRAMLAAVRGEYQGTSQTARDRQGQGGGGMRGWMIIAIFIVIILQSIFGRRRGTMYSRRGRRGMWMFPGGGGGFGGGRGGGGSFSGGGGSFGGGGAGGRW